MAYLAKFVTFTNALFAPVYNPLGPNTFTQRPTTGQLWPRIKR